MTVLADASIGTIQQNLASYAYSSALPCPNVLSKRTKMNV
jgi:hypothetical protein